MDTRLCLLVCSIALIIYVAPPSIAEEDAQQPIPESPAKVKKDTPVRPGKVVREKVTPKPDKKVMPSSVTAEVKLRAYTAINDVMTDARNNVEQRLSFLDDFLKHINAADDYRKSEYAKGDGPKSPMTFDEAFTRSVTRAAKNESWGDVGPIDAEGEELEQLVEAQRKLARKVWNDFIPLAQRAERIEAYLRDSEQWDAFLEWVDDEIQKRKRAREARRQRIEQKERKEAERLAYLKKKQEQEREARAERLRKRRLAAEQRAWERRVQMYKLRTERLEALEPEYHRYHYDRYDHHHDDDDDLIYRVVPE